MPHFRNLPLLLCLLAVCGSLRAAREFVFTAAARSEVIADIEARAPGGDWAVAGREAAVLELRSDGRAPQHVVLHGGEQTLRYRVFLGRFAPGAHRLRVDRDPARSAPGVQADVRAVRFEVIPESDPFFAVAAHAPVIHPRPGPFGRFSDIPLLTYCERKGEGAHPALEYTVIFSNEDGGTSTRALMARWGRTTDIEFLYRVEFDPTGRALLRTIQAKDHEIIEFTGALENLHPLLQVSTMNNMVAAGGKTDVRYQPAPMLVDLSRRSRESVMDRHPETWRAMGRELVREGKLRAYGTVEGEKISDPGNYLFLEFEIAAQNASTAVYVRLEDEARWRSSHLGRADFAIERSGVVRTTVELPPRTSLSQVAEIGFACVQREPEKDKKPAAPPGECVIGEVGAMFFLDESGAPGPHAGPFQTRGNLRLAAGEMLAVPLPRAAGSPAAER